jgi:hypothetical protein
MYGGDIPALDGGEWSASRPGQFIPGTRWRLGGHRSRSGRDGEKKKSHHCPCRELNPIRPAHNLVSIPTNIRESEWEGVDWIYMTQDSDQ